jgi:hypothetical protein
MSVEKQCDAYATEDLHAEGAAIRDKNYRIETGASDSVWGECTCKRRCPYREFARGILLVDTVIRVETRERC